MDIIRETSFYATQCDHETLKSQAERQLSFANIWLNFVRKKKSTTTSRYPITIPMWLLPGIHFLRHICSLQFTNQIDNDFFSEFYSNMKKAIYYLNNSHDNDTHNQDHIRSKTLRRPSITKSAYDKKKKKELRLNRIEQLDRMDKRIDRRRFDDGLIGKIKRGNKTPTLSKKMEDDIAYLKIRDFRKLNLLSRGQFATSKNGIFKREKKLFRFSTLPGSNWMIIQMSSISIS